LEKNQFQIISFYGVIKMEDQQVIQAILDGTASSETISAFHRKDKIDILTGKKPGTYNRFSDRYLNTQKNMDQNSLSTEEFMLKYSPFHNPELRMTLEEIKEMDYEDVALYKEKEAKRKSELFAKHNKIAC
jgi:hypothetical protein